MIHPPRSQWKTNTVAPPLGLVELSGSTVSKKTNFAALASAIASVDGNASTTPVTMSSYTPSNTARACPAVAANSWLASDVLPPTPNTTICENMVQASSCVPAAGLSANATASLFGTVCGLDVTACKGISSNATTGEYGAYVMCNSTQQLTNALNTYYSNQKKASTACDFDGQATVVKPTATLIPVNGTSVSQAPALIAAIRPVPVNPAAREVTLACASSSSDGAGLATLSQRTQ